jgi:hypothetical protein
MECPVCRGNVENLTPAMYKGLVLSCRRCGAYRIMPGSVAVLPTLKVEERLAALQRAKRFASRKSLPTINRACL